MRSLKWGLLFGVALTAGCASAPRAPTTLARAQCDALPNVEDQLAVLYGEGNVRDVQPLYRVEHRARAIQLRYVSGAKIYVPAQANTSNAYLERVLTCHAASNANHHPSDPLQVANVVDVDVHSRGPAYEIVIEGADRTAGKQIFERASVLHRSAGTVEVRQLSSTAAPTQF